VLAHPLNQSGDFYVPPHPSWEALEGRLGALSSGSVAHVAVDRSRVRPVRLDCDDGKAVFLDEPPGDRGTSLVEFRRPMTGLAQKHDPTIGEAIEQPTKGRIIKLGQVLGRVGDHVRQGLPS